MKTTMRSRVVCMAFAALFLMSTAAYAVPIAVTEEPQGYYITEPYEYPILPGTAEWEALPNNLAAKVNACAVPLDTLEHMTTGALLETVLTYPLLDNIFAFNTIEQGIESVSGYFHGINVLREREDAPQAVALMSQANAYFATAQSSVKPSGEMILRDLRLNALTELLSDNPEVPSAESQSCLQPSGPTGAIFTPQGTWVEFIPNGTFIGHWSTTAEAQEELADSYLNMYSSAEKLRDIDPTYNCHSFAWFCQETENHVVIENPYPYICDGSYLSGSTKVNSIILYENQNYVAGNENRYVHSARVYSLPSGTTPTVVISKWDCNCLFRHEVNDCPYVGVSVNASGQVIEPASSTTTVSAWNWNSSNPGEPCPGM